MSTTQPTFFLSHGGGPWPYMQGEFRQRFAALEASLKALPGQLPERPKAILMISGHWESDAFEVMASAKPPMVYDYSGFPPHTFQVSYPAPGDPALAQHVSDLIGAAGLPTRLNQRQGFDHGAFAPMAVMYPLADVPLLQLSMMHGEDPGLHLRLGQALAPLRDEGILIVGSGLSFHNLSLFGPPGTLPSRQFDEWLQEALLKPPLQRARALTDWASAPAARQAHPHADHLIPLMVAVGAAFDDRATCIYREEQFFGGLTVSSFRLG
jgi:aromatic ring-opening dioxygenase catalytic subunit (LigB family)